MTDSTVVMTLFCEDIREEKQLHSLMGIFPSNVSVGSFPAHLPKLGIYTRAFFNPKSGLNNIELFMVQPDGSRVDLTNLQAEIARAREETLADGGPLAGVISKGVAIPFQVSSPGIYSVFARIDGVERMTGFMHIRPSQTEPAQPA